MFAFPGKFLSDLQYHVAGFMSSLRADKFRQVENGLGGSNAMHRGVKKSYTHTHRTNVVRDHFGKVKKVNIKRVAYQNSVF